MNREIQKLKQAINEIRTLATDVARDRFIPSKFRRAPFTPELRDSYVEYLKKQIEGLEKRLAAKQVVSD